jgi:release factor glutamine methyltransferase
MAAPATTGTVREALGSATDALAAAGVDSPRLDAELLLAAATGRDRAGLAADPGAAVDARAARRFGGMVRRRVAREPVAYILGSRGFRRIDLATDSRALIPRPETELLVEIALELEPSSVLDVGTGGGAIALAVADELPGCAVTAVDTSRSAIALAGENAERLGLAERVRFEVGTLPTERRFDLVLANLPYVRMDELRSLEPEIANFEPRNALLSGSDGLQAIRGLAGALGAGAGEAAIDCEAAALEVGAGQADEVGALLDAAGFASVEARRDLAGIERVVLARR